MPIPLPRTGRQNGTEVPFSPLGQYLRRTAPQLFEQPRNPCDGLDVLTEDELKHRANENHHQVLGCLRKAVMHAMDAGAALLVLKKRHGKHGEWQQWLKAHFNGSARTARVYMRIARKWPLIAASPWQEIQLEGLTLAKLRRWLSVPKTKPQETGPTIFRPFERPPEEFGDPEPDPKPSEDKPGDDFDPSGPSDPLPAPDPGPRLVKVWLKPDDDEFDRWIELLKIKFGTTTVSDTVREAVKRCAEAP